MVKVIDIAWIADKALDLYCASLNVKGTSIEPKRRFHSASVSASIGEIFANVFNSAVDKYSVKYDKVFIVVPCFPIMRMRQASIISRFICKNADFLFDLGVSSNQFQDFFEKFISIKCKNEYATKVNDKCFLLNGRGVLLHDWLEAIVAHYGSSLVDFAKTAPFDSNPGCICTMEHNLSVFTETSEETKFKIGELIKNLT